MTTTTKAPETVTELTDGERDFAHHVALGRALLDRDLGGLGQRQQAVLQYAEYLVPSYWAMPVAELLAHVSAYAAPETRVGRGEVPDRDVMLTDLGRARDTKVRVPHLRVVDGDGEPDVPA